MFTSLVHLRNTCSNAKAWAIQNNPEEVLLS